jgi:hypothetical protein
MCVVTYNAGDQAGIPVVSPGQLDRILCAEIAVNIGVVEEKFGDVLELDEIEQQFLRL